MQPNPLLKRLGFTPGDRVVIIHTDDIGMCQASVEAFANLYEACIISSGAVMVPCPWFLAAAQFARQHPQADLGVHLTLTSEWQTYRWGPVSTRSATGGLLDAEGYFPHRQPEIQEKGDPASVGVELEAQIKRAFQFGMQPTHIDTHMGAVAHIKFMSSYVELAWRYHLPPMIPRLDVAGYQALGMDPAAAAAAAHMIAEQESNRLPLIDHMVGLPLDTPQDRMERTKQAFAALEPGITHFIIHPSVDTPELRDITPDWACRAADYQDFLNTDLLATLSHLGIHVIGYRALQEVMPKI
jgi:predicted glycoside hydrolase/deacetylase ChbG (UPF0249 family)